MDEQPQPEQPQPREEPLTGRELFWAFLRELRKWLRQLLQDMVEAAGAGVHAFSKSRSPEAPEELAQGEQEPADRHDTPVDVPRVSDTDDDAT